MTVHPRSDWVEAGYPMTGSSPTQSEWAYNTLHWPGGNVNVNDPIGTLRAWQRSWVNSRGYSLGYNFAVFPDGSQWEVRGFSLRCAANGAGSVNRKGIAINLCVDNVNTAPTAAMMTAVQDLIAQTRARVNRSLTINCHCDVRPSPTGCPGTVIIQQVRSGLYEPGATPVPPEPTPIPPTPTPTPPSEDWMANLPTIKKGDSGAAVKRMQHLLAAAGYMNEANTANYDGVWGNGTDGAKQRFDTDHGLLPSPPTDCGDKSWAALNGA